MLTTLYVALGVAGWLFCGSAAISTSLSELGSQRDQGQLSLGVVLLLCGPFSLVAVLGILTGVFLHRLNTSNKVAAAKRRMEIGQ